MKSLLLMFSLVLSLNCSAGLGLMVEGVVTYFDDKMLVVSTAKGKYHLVNSRKQHQTQKPDCSVFYILPLDIIKFEKGSNKIAKKCTGKLVGLSGR